MRYFKWGVARLILESEPCPDVMAIWMDGPQQVMNEKRTWPRPMPRVGKDINFWFGEPVNTDKVFGPFRQRWQDLKSRARRKQLALHKQSESSEELPEGQLGELKDDFLRYSPEAEQLRIDVTMAVRNEVLKVRRMSGLPDEDPKCGLAETWRQEGGKKEGEMKDGGVVVDM